MRSTFLGIVLVVLGTLFLLSNFGMIPHIGPLLRQWWPLVFILWGIFILMSRGRN